MTALLSDIFLFQIRAASKLYECLHSNTLVRDKNHLYPTGAKLDHVNACLGPGSVVNKYLFSPASDVGSGLGLPLSRAKLHV